MQNQPTVTNMTIADLLNRWPQTVSVFQKHKMLCAGCAVASLFTVTEVTNVYGLATDVFSAELQQTIEVNKNGSATQADI